MTHDPEADRLIIPDLLAPQFTPATSSCTLCNWTSQEWPTTLPAGCEATWHVYENHPQEWLRVIGDRPPVDVDPRKDRP